MYASKVTLVVCKHLQSTRPLIVSLCIDVLRMISSIDRILVIQSGCLDFYGDILRTSDVLTQGHICETLSQLFATSAHVDSKPGENGVMREIDRVTIKDHDGFIRILIEMIQTSADNPSLLEILIFTLCDICQVKERQSTNSNILETYFIALKSAIRHGSFGPIGCILDGIFELVGDLGQRIRFLDLGGRDIVNTLTESSDFYVLVKVTRLIERIDGKESKESL